MESSEVDLARRELMLFFEGMEGYDFYEEYKAAIDDLIKAVRCEEGVDEHTID